jgi:hypothetical protein
LRGKERKETAKEKKEITLLLLATAVLTAYARYQR